MNNNKDKQFNKNSRRQYPLEASRKSPPIQQQVIATSLQSEYKNFMHMYHTMCTDNDLTMTPNEYEDRNHGWKFINHLSINLRSTGKTK
jgi:hypothetical protein